MFCYIFLPRECGPLTALKCSPLFGWSVTIRVNIVVSPVAEQEGLWCVEARDQ
jgi:hypothetical protein